MNLLNIVILISIFTNISFGYKTNCTDEVSKPCTVFMTPTEDAYQNVFIKLLGPVLRYVYHLGLNPNQTKPKDIAEENEKMQMYLDSSTIVR
uniref:Secreted protein n=1 Tax=Strongyloides papillosus TaxID=174720 RepID=A0A0N5BL79_STREA